VTEPRVLVIDVETAPLTLSGWGLREQNFGLAQVLETSRLLCFAAKWYGKPRVHFSSEWQHGQAGMLERAHKLLSDADVVVAHNAPFDVKQFNTAFLLAGMSPPAPFQTIDTLRAVRSRFFLASNRLDHIARVLGLGQKVSHEGHGLWLRVLDGHGPSRRLMREYNEHDVILCEAVLEALWSKGWVPDGPHVGAIAGRPDGCPQCGGARLHARGVARTKVSAYQRFQCQDCGGWCRGNKALPGRATTRGVR
jgi:hypothetical protein